MLHRALKTASGLAQDAIRLSSAERGSKIWIESGTGEWQSRTMAGLREGTDGWGKQQPITGFSRRSEHSFDEDKPGGGSVVPPAGESGRLSRSGRLFDGRYCFSECLAFVAFGFVIVCEQVGAGD